MMQVTPEQLFSIIGQKECHISMLNGQIVALMQELGTARDELAQLKGESGPNLKVVEGEKESA